MPILNSINWKERQLFRKSSGSRSSEGFSLTHKERKAQSVCLKALMRRPGLKAGLGNPILLIDEEDSERSISNKAGE